MAERMQAVTGTVETPVSQSRQSAVAGCEDTGVSHNLHGQKLGRKGRGTRERILNACAEILAEGDEVHPSLSAVARRAGLGMTSLYNYFTDLTELLLAVLEPVTQTAEEAYLSLLRERWPDEELGARSLEFMRALHGYWATNARLLHLRNAMADARDTRMTRHRIESSQPMISLLRLQMDGDPVDPGCPTFGMATVLMTGIERTVTVATDERLRTAVSVPDRNKPEYYIVPEARLMELAIRDMRQQMAERHAGTAGAFPA